LSRHRRSSKVKDLQWGGRSESGSASDFEGIKRHTTYSVQTNFGISI
jgi:hypothetical protein